jgi:dienelactone hydrolase
MKQDDPLEDFARRNIALDGVAKVVYVAGSGPAVIVMAEMPGISPHVARFARWVRDAGFTVYMPSLFGRDGAVPQAEEGMAVLQRACVSAEFRALADGRTRPIATWLRGLARVAHAECGGPGVGAIGMCFTGNFALSMMLEPAMLAPVLSQPSLPFPVSAKHKRSIDISPDDLAVVKQRCATEGLQVLGLRFKGDAYVPAARFEFLREQLGDAFVAVELDDSAANPNAVMKNPHSVLTEHLVDEPGQPTRAALDQVLDLFRTKLLVP